MTNIYAEDFEPTVVGPCILKADDELYWFSTVVYPTPDEQYTILQRREHREDIALGMSSSRYWF